MDEEDSQDELIARSSSHRRGKRPVSSIVSDEEEESDESGDDSEEGESGDEDDDDDDGEENPDGEDDEDDEEEEDEEEDDSDGEEHEALKAQLEGAVGGAVGGPSTDLSYLSSDEDAEKCPICLNSFHEQPVATPESCEHYFCLDCILEWSKNANSCPVDRIVFNKICLRKNHGGKVQKVITLQKPAKAGQEEEEAELDHTNCEVCGQSDREDRLLLCDGCDAGYHMECLTPPLDAVPVEEWFCPRCSPNSSRSGGSTAVASSSAVPSTSRTRASVAGPTRAIARTQQSERVRANVNRNRITQARAPAEVHLHSAPSSQQEKEQDAGM